MNRLDARFAALKAAGPRRLRGLCHGRRSRPRTSVRDPARPARGRGRHHRAGLSLLRPDGRGRADPEGVDPGAEGRARRFDKARSNWCAASAPRTTRHAADPDGLPQLLLDPRLSSASPTTRRRPGVDGLIVVDCPPEEAGPLTDALDARRASPDPPDHADHGRRAASNRREADLGLRLLRLGGRRDGRQGGRRRSASPPPWRGCARLRACPSRSDSASDARARRRRSPASRTPSWSARRWWTRSPRRLT